MTSCINFEQHKFIPNKQHDTHKQWSTADHLLKVTHIWGGAVQLYRNTTVVALDIPKEFDDLAYCSAEQTSILRIPC